MKNPDLLDSETFETLLDWLASDRESAGEKYEQIRHSLIQILEYRGAVDAEDLADQVINRVASKLPSLAETYVGEPALYFYGVAKNLLKQQQQKREQLLPLEGLDFPTRRDIEEGITEDVYECLDQCLRHLSLSDQKVITQYYEGQKQSKIKFRGEIARRLKINPNALRVKIYRIRASLERCVRGCLEKKQL
jgi:DNA-directed RNA polymerase specialized sigma24 family protein